MNSEPRRAEDAPPRQGPCFPVDIATLGESIPFLCPEVAPLIAQRTFDAGAGVVPTCEEGHRIRIVASGAIREEAVLEDGRRQILRFLMKGDALVADGDMAGVRYAGVRPGVLYELSDESFRLCKCRPLSPESWRRVQDEQRLRTIVHHVVMLGRYSAEERIASFLDDLVERIGLKEAGGYSLTLPMGREDIADYLGLKAETVSRQLGRLKKNGTLELLKPGQIMVRDRKGLADLVPHFADTV